MTILVISTQAGGKGDLIFGCKLARFLQSQPQSQSKEKIYLINAIPDHKVEGFALSGFDAVDIALLASKLDGNSLRRRVLELIETNEENKVILAGYEGQEDCKKASFTHPQIQQLQAAIDKLDQTDKEKLTGKLVKANLSNFDMTILEANSLNRTPSNLVTRGIFSNNNTPAAVEIIHFVFNGQGEKVEINPEIDNKLNVINFADVSRIFIGPGHSYNYLTGCPLPDLRFAFLENPSLDKEIPIYLITEYSYKCQVDTAKSCFEYAGFENVSVFETGLGKDEMGIFWDASSQQDTDIPTFVDSVINEFKKEQYQAPKDEYGGKWYQEKWQKPDVIKIIRDAIGSADCFSVYYNSSEGCSEHFRKFIRMHKKLPEYKKSKKSFVLVILPDLCFFEKEEIDEWNNVGCIFLKSIDFLAMQAFYRIAKSKPGIGGCTGDQSLSDTLSAKLIPVYYKELHKNKLAQYLAQECLKNLSNDVKEYLSSFLFDYNTSNKSENVKTKKVMKAIEQIHTNIELLFNEKNLTKNLTESLKNFESNEEVRPDHTYTSP